MRAAGRVLAGLARAILLIASLVFAVILLGMLFVVLDANPTNGVVQVVTSAARFLVGPFEGLFAFRDGDLATGVNWGIAALVWLIAGALVAALLRRLGRSAAGRRGQRR